MPTGYGYAAGFTIVGLFAIPFGHYWEAATLFILAILLCLLTLYAFYIDKKGV